MGDPRIALRSRARSSRTLFRGELRALTFRLTKWFIKISSGELRKLPKGQRRHMTKGQRAMIAAKIEVVLNTTHCKAAKTVGTSREYVNRAARAGRARARAVAHGDSAQPSFGPVLCPSATSGPTFQPSRHWRAIKAPANCAGPFKNLPCEESLAVGESLTAEHMEQCRHTEQGESIVRQAPECQCRIRRWMQIALSPGARASELGPFCKGSGPSTDAMAEPLRLRRRRRGWYHRNSSNLHVGLSRTNDQLM